MEPRVKLSKDGTSIDFTTSESLPTSLKKFRQSPEIEGFYRFIFENDLQKEALEILERIIIDRKGRREQKSAKPAATKVEAPAKVPVPKVLPAPAKGAKSAAPKGAMAKSAPAKVAKSHAGKSVSKASPAKSKNSKKAKKK